MSGGKAPIRSLPIISEPFHTVYIDLVGPIHPLSGEGHSYLLTRMSVDSGYSFSLRWLPVISEPFHTVYIDLVGPIHPLSGEGHSYLLTMLDSATHYMLAVPMKKIDSISIAESLMKQFDQFGYPKIYL